MNKELTKLLETKQYSKAIVPYGCRLPKSVVRDPRWCNPKDTLIMLREIFDFMLKNAPDSCYTLLAADNLRQFYRDVCRRDDEKRLEDFIRLSMSRKGISEYETAYFSRVDSAADGVALNPAHTVNYFNTTALFDERFGKGDYRKFLTMLRRNTADEGTLLGKSVEMISSSDKKIASAAIILTARILMVNRWLYSSGMIIERFRNKLCDIINDGCIYPTIWIAAFAVEPIFGTDTYLEKKEKRWPEKKLSILKEHGIRPDKQMRFRNSVCNVWFYLVEGKRHRAEKMMLMLEKISKNIPFIDEELYMLSRLKPLIAPNKYDPGGRKDRLYREYFLTLARDELRDGNPELAKEILEKIPINSPPFDSFLYLTYLRDYYALMFDICVELELREGISTALQKYVYLAKRTKCMDKNGTFAKKTVKQTEKKLETEGFDCCPLFIA